MKYFLTLALFIACNSVFAQRDVLTTDTTIAIPALHFDSGGNLLITASSISSQRDFDFLVGSWKMYHRRLNKRLENNNEWTKFTSTDSNYLILSGTADFDIYRTTEMPGM